MSKVITDEKLVDEVLTRGIAAVYPTKEALKKELLSGRRLKIYLGIDPTAPHLHFGHAEQLLLLKRLLALGHEIILLIGDFTAQIGDPTDKSAARVPLTPAEIKANLRTFKKQASKILKIKGVLGGDGATIRSNSEWHNKMSFADVVRLAQSFTVQQMLERDMFAERIKNQKPIGLHEFLYPLMQGYDSVAMNVDAEIGGNDQTFNMLAGRTLQKKYNNKEKYVIASKLLENPETGKKLMSKSEGNTINLDDTPKDIFGKIMSLEDAGMFLFAELSTEMDIIKIEELKKAVSEGGNPRDAKLEIAAAGTALIYGEAAGEKEKVNFTKVFSDKTLPEDMPELDLSEAEISAVDLVVLSGVAESKSVARRLIEQGALEVGGRIERDIHATLLPQDGEVVRIGKKYFAKIRNSR